MTQLIEESADATNYREVDVRKTALDLSIEQAEEDLKLYVFAHPTMTVLPGGTAVVHGSDAHLDELATRVNDLQQQRQRLLPLWADLKTRVAGGHE